jgi:dUTPase
MKIYCHLQEGASLPKVINVGDWIDLCVIDDITIKEPTAETLKRKKKDGEIIDRFRNVKINDRFISFGIAMRLPDGYEAVIAPRSSAYQRYGFILPNSPGVIDNSYCGLTDFWGARLVSLKGTNIPKGKAICQFRIQLSQKATIWQKIKWFFSNGKIEFVDDQTKLVPVDRGGFGSTDK